MGDNMKRFITKKIIKIPRYKLLYLISVFSIVLIIVVNILINGYLKKIDSAKFLNIIMGNATGNILKNYNIYQNNSNMFYKNIYGFNFNRNKPATNKVNNLKDIIIDAKELGEAEIYLYNTFQTDKYKNNYYNSYTVNPLVTEANLILKEYLKNYGLNAIVETKSVAKTLKENNLLYTESYKGSRILLEDMSKNNSSLQYFFDIQLSVKERQETTAVINNINYAKILFVIGTDNKNYKKNLDFANRLNVKLSDVNVLLSRGISLQGGAGYHGIYNQDFNTNTLLIQVGGKENTIDEVDRTLKVLAKVLATYIEEEKNEKE